jgi:Ca2+-binding RTX toxin-like protein
MVWYQCYWSGSSSTDVCINTQALTPKPHRDNDGDDDIDGGNGDDAIQGNEGNDPYEVTMETTYF